MESSTPLRQSASVASRLSALSQLDKINAIPNKNTNNVLMDGLCHEDKLYLDALMDEDSLDSDEETPNLTNHGRSTWSPPMASRPMMNSKRIKRMKRLKPAYTITMSLEDISYIRPSWGISKGIKRIELIKDKGKQKSFGGNGLKIDKALNSSVSKSQTQGDNKSLGEQANGQMEGDKKSPVLSTYNLLLSILVLILISLMVLSYFVEVRRSHEKMYRSRLEFMPGERQFNIMSMEDGKLVRNNAFQVHYGQGIPRNLRHTECSCEMYEAETRRHHQSNYLDNSNDNLNNVGKASRGRDGDCFACYDWSHRANVQIFVNSSRPLISFHNHDTTNPPQRPTQRPVPLDEDQSITCYEVKWQSYDTLRTPLIDCFHINDNDHWLGLGDIQRPTGFLNKINQPELVAITSNLSSEFFESSLGSSPNTLENVPKADWGQATANDSMKQIGASSRELVFGSFAEFELLTQSGFFVGNVRTDFQPAIRISTERRKICLSVACNGHCSRIWTKLEDVKRYKYRNNLLEYTICSASNLKVLVAQLVNERSRRFALAGSTTPGPTQPVTSSNGQLTQVGSQSKQMANEPVSSGDQSSLLERLEIAGEGQVQPVVVPNPIGNLKEPKMGHTGPVSVPLVAETASAPAQQQTKRQLDGLGLIEGTVFVTSPEYIELLDGKTLRQHADQIVKLNLKTKPILILDSRWQLYLGSFQINSAHFPKAKLLFEILHNKGFKLVLTVKPYIDATIGIANLNQLLESGRIVGAQYENLASGSEDSNKRLMMGQSYTIYRRQSFFIFKNESVHLMEQTGDNLVKAPFLFRCKESHDGHCALIDLANFKNRLWLIDLIKRSNFISQEADGILFGGAHPNSIKWDGADGYRVATSELIDKLFFKENLFVIPQWTGNFNCIQLAPRSRDWNGLRSVLSSVLTLSALGFSLVHPGSVWGDLKCSRAECVEPMRPVPKLMASVDDEERYRAEEELVIRWLQLAVFLPVLQFNDLGPIDKFHLHDQLQHLIKLRKLYVVPEIKKHLPHSPLLVGPSPDLNESPSRQATTASAPQLPALRQIWSNMIPNGGGPNGGGLPIPPPAAGTNSNPTGGNIQPQQQQIFQAAEAASQQFMIGPDMLVAPALNAGQRQKDIYLPAGQWHDELRQTNVRGGKWLRNYPIELNEIAWFTRAKR